MSLAVAEGRGRDELRGVGDVAVYLGGDLLRDGQAPRRRLLPGGQRFERLVVAARLCDHLLFRVRGLVLGTLAKNSVPQIPQQLADDRRRQVNIPANSLALVPPTLLAHVGFRDGVVELIHLRDVVLPRVPLTWYGGWQRSLIGLVVFDTGHVSQHRALEEPEADYLRRDLERHDDVDGVAAHERCELLGGHGEEDIGARCWRGQGPEDRDMDALRLEGLALTRLRGRYGVVKGLADAFGDWLGGWPLSSRRGFLLLGWRRLRESRWRGTDGFGSGARGLLRY